MATNPQTMTVDLGGRTGTADVLIKAEAHAAFRQRVALELKSADGKHQAVTFNGTGENVPMKDGGGADKLYITGWQLPIKIVATYSFSSNGGRSYQNVPDGNVIPKTLVDSPQVQVVQVTTEDFHDNDDNDTYLHVIAH
ncbi:MAG: hypothetical protein AAF533_11555 [Acidobacteriota bacterium]